MSCTISDSRRGAASALNIFIAIFAAISCAAVCPAESPAPQDLVPDLPSSSSAEEQGVRAAYDAFAERAAIAGFPIRFELEDFQTVGPEKFKDHSLTRLITLETPRYVQVTARSLYKDESGFSSFKLEWQNRSASEADRIRRGIRELSGKSIRDLKTKGSIRGEEGPMDPFVAITTYRVRVELQGEAASYRAAVLWQDSPAEKSVDVNFSLRDFVVRGIGPALSHSNMMIAWTLMEDPEKKWMWRQEPLLRPTKWDGSQGCEARQFQENTTVAVQMNDASGHNTGKHQAILDVKATCSHNQNCTVGCTPAFQAEVCLDTGDIAGFTCYNGYSDWQSQLAANSGFNEAVTCSGAMGCQVEHCCLGNCSSGGVSVSFSGGPVSLTANSSGYDYKMDLSDTSTCPPPQQSDDGSGGGGGQTGCSTPHACDSPILFDFGDRGLDLSAAADGALFDIDSDVDAELVAWPDGDDAFLVLDRNTDRRIENGYELFGSYSPQQLSSELEPNGFTALQVYDSPRSGGNGDGWIDAEDGIFPLLRVWHDRDRDGEADRHELAPLAKYGIQALGLQVFERKIEDEHGNELRYWGLYVDHTGDSEPLIDVFLQKEEL